jgi:gluconate 2-dehydrogenase gamma chain
MTEAPLFLNDHQRYTLQAAMERVMPADDDPGATDAGTVIWLDRYLSGTGYIHAKPDGSGFLNLGPREAAVWLGRIDRLRAVYAAGLSDLDLRSSSQYGHEFSRLAPGQQDEILRQVEQAEATPSAAESDASAQRAAKRANENSFDEDTAPFFQLLVAHTRQAFYSDPVYGGNRDRVGWKTIGFPGPMSLADTQANRYTTEAYFADGTDLDVENS